MQNKLLKIARMGFALAVLSFGALPALGQDCKGWMDKNWHVSQEFWKNITSEQVQICLDNGADVNARDEDGNTPLVVAALDNVNPEVIMVLLKAGADVNARTSRGYTALHGALVRNINFKVIMALLDAGANANARLESGETPFSVAVWSGANLEIITALLDAGADVKMRDQYGETPLHESVSSNSNYEIVSALLDAGADVNARDEDGNTPLIAATSWNNERVSVRGRGVAETVQNKVKKIEILLNAGADLSAKSFYYAAERQPPEVVTALLNAGADVNEGSGEWTPLHTAAYGSKNPEVIMVLLKAGADGKVKDSRGRTAFDLAKEYNEAIKGTDAYWALNDARY